MTFLLLKNHFYMLCAFCPKSHVPLMGVRRFSNGEKDRYGTWI